MRIFPAKAARHAAGEGTATRHASGKPGKRLLEARCPASAQRRRRESHHATRKASALVRTLHARCPAPAPRRRRGPHHAARKRQPRRRPFTPEVLRERNAAGEGHSLATSNAAAAREQAGGRQRHGGVFPLPFRGGGRGGFTAGLPKERRRESLATPATPQPLTLILT